MASKFVFELNRAGVRDLLKGEEMQSICSSYGDAILSVAGEGYKKTVHVGRNRANCSVKTDTPKAYYSNLKHNTLINALGAAKK